MLCKEYSVDTPFIFCINSKADLSRCLINRPYLFFLEEDFLSIQSEHHRTYILLLLLRP